MKTKKITHLLRIFWVAALLISWSVLQAQIQFQGLISENEGSASWDADGTGPEPYGNGHGTYLYYAASRDYVNPNSDYGAHVTAVADDFPAFAQTLTDNGFLPGQVKLRMGLASQGDDLEGSDWFDFGNEKYLNFYPVEVMLYLNNELLITGLANYIIFHYGVSTQWQFVCTSNYFVPVNTSGSSSQAVQNVAAAFIQDVGDYEIRLVSNTFGGTQGFTGNGRIGTYFNINGTLDKGRPKLPFQGLAANHEGFAGWDADGTGPEPKRQGHTLAPGVNQRYYIASVDYEDIDPDPQAAFARILEAGIDGFQNFKLQLAYRGFSPEQVKFKMGLRSLDEDIYGEDWWIDGTIHHINFYQSIILAEIDGEPLFSYVCDTNSAWFDLANPYNGWASHTACAIPCNTSESSSDAVKKVAMSFFKDLESRNIHAECDYLNYTGQTFTGNGRTGVFLEVVDAQMVATPPIGTYVQSGNVTGHWTIDSHPYIVTGDITVPDGQTLTIDPGVWVKFTDRIHFKVEGAVVAAGDSCNTGCIVFTAANPDLGWGHIVFDGTTASNPASVFRHCIFEYGSAPSPVPYSSPDNSGGAIGMRNYDSVIIENCLFHHNRALFNGEFTASGGAIALWNSSPEIRNCVFSSNSANWAGGITCYSSSSPTIANCLFYRNTSLKNTLDGGGAILISTDSDPILLNNTFVDNHSNFKGGAIEIYAGSEPDLINNIFWGNTAPQNSQIFISSNNCNVDIKYNNIEGGLAGIGPFGIGTGVYENNIDADPEFADVLALNYQLSEGSPCIDAGIPDVTGLNLPPYDLLGNVRIWDGGSGLLRVDMGAYEFDAPLFTGIHQRFIENSYAHITGFPNPFFTGITIEYTLKEAVPVIITILNEQGQEIRVLVNETQSAGTHYQSWNAGNIPSGLYYCRLQASKQIITRKIAKL